MVIIYLNSPSPVIFGAIIIVKFLVHCRLMESMSYLTRNERQRRLNAQLSILPKFEPLNDYEVCLINHSTSTMQLQNLIELARQTSTFTIDTEQDYYSHQPALIQIEFVEKRSVVVLIETCHLPHRASILFWLIRSLCKVIFQSDKLILAWGDIINELSTFIDYGLFSLNSIQHIHTMDVQHLFKPWYNERYPHQCGLSPSADDHITCTCPHRVVKNKNDRWSLQKAIAYLFDEFLDKSRTKSHWSRRLVSRDVRRFSITNRKESECRELIAYAVNDCLAVTKLFTKMQAD